MNSLLRWSSSPNQTVLRRRNRRACFESLERRALLSATISVNDITAAAASHNVTVTYSDPAGIDAGSIGNDDLSIGGPKAVNVQLTNVSGGGTEVVATYSLAGPGGSWDQDDNGGYSVSVNAGSIKTAGGTDADLSGGSANFNVAVPPPPDTTGPSTSISVGDITTAGGSTHTVSVTYSDSSGIDQGSIGTSDITVEHDGNSLNVTDVDISGSGDSRTAVYTIAAPGGSWDQSDNGTYTVTVNAGAVEDNSANSNGNAANSDSFTVNAPPPADASAPTASISVGDVNGPTATHTVSVEYSDNVAINTSSIDAGDINVSFNGSSLSVTNVQVTPSGNGKKATAVYTVAGPGGSFDHTDNGTYVVRVVPGAVTDSSGNGAISSPTNFDVNIAAPVDNTGPTASIGQIGTITTAGGTSFNVVVTYTDETAMDASSIGPADLNVSRNGPGGDLSVTGVSTNVSADGKVVTATYTVAAPGGSFDAVDNGDYTVSVVTSQVRDAADNNVQSASAGFSINIALADVLPPAAVISAANITTAGGATHAITVVYTDDTAMDVSSIGPGNITVTGPGGALTVTGASTSVSLGGKVVTATYTVAAPGGGFDAADNGSYSVSLNANAARDAAGNGAVGIAINFNIAITGAPPVDTTGPAITSITAPNINAPGGATQTVTVVYTDETKVRASSIGKDDIVVTRGGTTLVVTDVSTTSANDGKQITAVYTLAAPGGTWDNADNGEYTITVPQAAVSDTKGNFSSPASGAFTVNATVTDTANPVVAGIVAGNVTTEGVSSHVVTVTYTDDAGLDPTSFGTDDLTVSGPGGTLVINVISTATGEDGKSATVTYTFASPGDQFLDVHNGTYTITVNAGAVTDASGKPVAAASGSFTVAVPPQTPIDPGFGDGNAVNTSFVAEAVAAAPDGKLIVVGRSGNSAVIERRNADGTVDTTFGNNGQVLRSQENAYYAVVVQGDKFVVAGTVGGDFVLVRFTSSGQVDQSFGGSERRAVITFGDAVTERVDEAYALALAPDGKLVAGGRTDGDFAFARFTSDGLIDNTFGQLGKQMYDVNGGDAIGALVVQADGKVVAAGTSGDKVAIVRLGTNGEADFGFSGDGLLIVTGLAARNDASVLDRSTALALQADGKILVGNHTSGGDFGIVRVDQNGNVDSSFGNDGIATADFGGNDDADAILVQPTGEILVVGTSLTGEAGMTTLAAFDSSGHLITEFADAGKLTLESGIVNSARELHLGDLVIRAFGTRQSDGRVVVGTSNTAPQEPTQPPPTTSQSALRRLNVPGTRSTPSGTAIGTFGVVNGRTQKLSFTDDDGTVITFTIKNGTGTAFRGSDGKINVVVNDAAGATLSIKARGGDGRVALGDVMVNGSLKSFSAKTGDLTGTMSIGGTAGKILLANVTNASICSTGNIGSITLTSLVNSKLLAGSNLGANAEFGGSGANADAYGAASIGKLRVSGVIQNSTVGAGLDPVDATFLDEDDRVIGGVTQSFIRSITAKEADSASRFLSASFGKVRLGEKVTPGEDPRFRILA